MAWTRKTKAGRWQGVYRDSNGKVRSAGGTYARKQEARQAADEEERKVRRGGWTDPKLGRRTFESWAQEVMAARIDRRPATRARDDSYLKNHVVAAFGDQHLNQITKTDVQAWVVVLSEEKELAARTTKECYRLLAGILAEAVEERLIPETPCRKVKLPRIENKEKRFLTSAEVEQLADAMAPEYRAAVFVGAYLGLRWGEMAGLKRKHLHLHQIKPQASIVGSLERFNNGFRYVEETKSTSGKRLVPIPAFLVEELAQHLAAAPAGDFVFASPAGDLLHYQNWRKRYWMPAVERAGLAPLTFHELRHTAAALMLGEDANLVTLQRRLGHRKSSTTTDFYGHLTQEQDDALTGRMDDMRSAAKLLHEASGEVIDLASAAQELGR